MDVDPRPRRKVINDQPDPKKAKGKELSRKALGSAGAITLSIKELETISPLMAEELVAIISESSGKAAEATTSSRLVNN